MHGVATLNASFSVGIGFCTCAIHLEMLASLSATHDMFAFFVFSSFSGKPRNIPCDYCKNSVQSTKLEEFKKNKKTTASMVDH
jgi:hypothetical protein